MKQIIDRYLNKFDELNVLFEKKELVVEEIEDFLIDSYLEGFISSVYLLGHEVRVPKDYKEKVLDWNYKEKDKETGETYFESVREKLVDYVNNNQLSDLKRLVESELHRAYNEGAYDSASLIADETNSSIKKMWVTMADDKVRDTHAYLEGLTVDLFAKFTTFDGDSALFPGGFDLAQNNANCRCIIEYTTV